MPRITLVLKEKTCIELKKYAALTKQSTDTVADQALAEWLETTGALVLELLERTKQEHQDRKKSPPTAANVFSIRPSRISLKTPPDIAVQVV